MFASSLGIAAVVVNSGPASGQVPVAPSTVLSPPKAVSPLGKPGEELVERRTRSSRTYLAEDGRGLIAQVFQTPVNYRDGSGSWRAIDSGLDLVDGAYRSRANRFAARLPKGLAGGEVRFSEGADAMSFSLRDAVGSARVNGAEATYSDAFAGVDVRYEMRADALKELITLKAASARREFVFDLKLSDGLRPVLEAGALAVRDSAGALVMSVPAPFMTDANGATSEAVGFALAAVQSGWRLTLTAADGWLDASDRAWPVDIDPVVYPGAQTDCKLQQSAPTTDACAMNQLAVGGAVGGEIRSVLRFDVDAAVPDGATVTYSSLKLSLTGQSSASQLNFVDVHRLTSPVAAGATWNSPWSTPGGDFSSTVSCGPCPAVGGPVGGGGKQPGEDVYWNIPDLTTAWANGTTANHGMLLKVDQIRGEGNVMTFASSEDLARAPHLSIRYEPRAGVLPGHKYESQQLGDRLSLAVNGSSGNLLVRARDLTVPGGLGPDLTIGRTYNGLQGQQHYAYGKGWSADTGPDIWLETNHPEHVVYHGPSGVGALFKQAGPTSYTTPPGFDATLEKTASGWTYTENASQRKLTFDSTGRLTRDQDRNDRALTFAYTGSGRQIQKVTDSQGRDTTFTYTSGRVTQMTDSAGRLYTYAYAANGELLKSTDPGGGETTFTYGSTGGIVLITTPAGRKTKITYLGPGAYEGRVASIIRVTNPTAAFASMTGPTTQFTYVQEQNGQGSGVLIDPRAKNVATVYDKNGLPIKTTDGAGRVTSNEYTSNYNVQSYTVAGNTGTTPNGTLLYDADNNLTGAQTPTTNATSPDCTPTSTTCIRSKANYGEAAGVAATVPGRQYLLTSSTNEQGRTRTLSYDATGNPKTIGSPAGTITLNYDPASPGKLTSIVDQRAKTTTYGYFASGDLQQITPPMPLGPTKLTYTATLSRIATVTDANNKLRTLSYDNLDRVTKIAYSDATSVAFVYDKDGNLTARNDSVGGNSTYVYDHLSRVTSETLPGAATTTYTYDEASNLKTLTDGGGTVTYDVYDGANRNTSLYHTTPGMTVAYTDPLNGTGGTVTTTYPNTVTVTRSADYAGRLTEIKALKAGVAIEHLKYEYDDATYGQGVLRARMIDVLAGKTTRYLYDSLDRLTRARTYYTTTGTLPLDSATCATEPRIACYEYTLDAAGNRTQRTVTGSAVTNSTATYVYNDANQMTTRTAAAAVSTYAYDANGNQTIRTGAAPRTLAYNLRDQTTNLAGTATGYLGAGQDQPVSEGSTTLQHNILGLGRRTTAGTASYYTRAEDGTVLTQRTGTSREYYVQDALGSTIRTTDTAGATTATYAYDPDGNTTTSTGTSTNPFRYAGGRLTTAGLYHYGQRYYDPTDARWTQPDPLNQATDLREANKYPYVGADPINSVDPSGEALFVPLVVLAVRAAAPIAYTAARTLVTRVGSQPRSVGSFSGRVAVHRHAGGPHQREHIQANWWRTGVSGSGGVFRWFQP